ncbi:MAG: UDP-N-acetylglucosamine 1-carboxyvinyltransferase [Thermodesulfobacteriota bacterium]|nr:UDP-N-acetylglucosamine 1-carboxyvinyltransferase [Thermodesulfobacteriota bacterium]
MDSFIIEGGSPLNGRVEISGSKNAALPVLCSSILAQGICTYANIPDLRDINTVMSLLNTMGLEVHRMDNGRIEVDPSGPVSCDAPYELVKSMRASILVLGPLLARYKEARVSLPGGCAIGVRPIDMHLKALSRMGADITLSHGYVHASTKGRLKGTRILFDRVTVGGTENIMMAACLAEGTTVIEGAAREPEIVDLAAALSSMGAQISGAGTSTVIIDGVEDLSGTRHTVIPDRIEVGTFIAAAAITKGCLELNGVCMGHIVAVVEKFREMGLEIKEIGPHRIMVDACNGLSPVEVSTSEYPGFPTDMQAQIMAVAGVASGVSTINETIFENRFMHVPELMRMGAELDEKGNTVIVRGVKRYEGAGVMATDLRASASLVLAGLNASGTTEIRRIYHLDRGYEMFDNKLVQTGAQIKRIRGGL